MSHLDFDSTNARGERCFSVFQYLFERGVKEAPLMCCSTERSLYGLPEVWLVVSLRALL